jgi:hypothetical protein
MARPTVLTSRVCDQLDALLACGVRQDVAGRAVGVSRRTVSRFVAHQRAASSLQTLDGSLADLPTLEEVLADRERPRRLAGRRLRAPKQDWQAVARMLEAEFPERWGGPPEES